MYYDVILVGGGAAGFFTAINIAERKPGLRIAIVERGKEVLSKVKAYKGFTKVRRDGNSIPPKIV